jgi:hypothetical protein
MEMEGGRIRHAEKGQVCYRKKKRMVQDFHYKLAHVLCRTYKTIIFPDFSTQGMGGLPDIVKKRSASWTVQDYLQHQRNSKR